MIEAMDKAALIASLKDGVFGNQDLVDKIRSTMDCEGIAEFCSSNSTFCERFAAARCLFLRVNENLQKMYNMVLGSGVQVNWNNDPVSELFMEVGEKFFAVTITVSVGPKIFLGSHPEFRPTIKRIAKDLATIFNVKVGELKEEEDPEDDQYARFKVEFTPNVPDEKRMLLPFSKRVEGHDNQISVSHVSNLDSTLDPSIVNQLRDFNHSQ